MDGSSAELVTGGQVVPSLDMDRLIVCRDKVVAGVGQAMQILTEAANLATWAAWLAIVGAAHAIARARA